MILGLGFSNPIVVIFQIIFFCEFLKLKFVGIMIIELISNFKQYRLKNFILTTVISHCTLSYQKFCFVVDVMQKNQKSFNHTPVAHGTPANFTTVIDSGQF